MTRVDKIEEGLPISVVIPHTKSRSYFFNQFVLPSIEANEPKEIIIIDDNMTAPVKRNMGKRKASEKYIFFCDDDCVLPANHLQLLYDAIQGGYEFAYSGYIGVVLQSTGHHSNNFRTKLVEFSVDRLKMGNYISTMTLVDSEKFKDLYFDESLKRFQDWDLWLNAVLNKNYTGVGVDSDFLAYFIDNGITNASNSIEDADKIVRRKYSL